MQGTVPWRVKVEDLSFWGGCCEVAFERVSGFHSRQDLQGTFGMVWGHMEGPSVGP